MSRLVEYEPTPMFVAPQDLGFILDAVKNSSVNDDSADDPRLFESITPTREPNTYVVRSGPVVGRIGLPSGDVIDFVSRFAFPDVLELIRRSGRRPVRIEAIPVATAGGESLVDMIALAFTRAVERLVGTGLAKGYRTVIFRRPPYPGTIDVPRHIGQLAARPDRLLTSARRITRDIEVNRALFAAIEVLHRTPLATDIGRRVARLRPAFAGVGLAAVPARDVAALNLTNITRRYEDALGLAELILRSRSLSPLAGSRAGLGIVFSMPKVWETYVCQCVRESLPDHHDVVQGYGFDLSHDGLKSWADVVVLDRGHVVGLYDAKYKRMGEGPSRADIYQMVTYCERLGVDEATLVYPAIGGSARIVRVGSRRVRTVGLPGPATRERSSGDALGSQWSSAPLRVE